MNKDLKKIKKLYGEEMMHLCRELFPTILETDGLLLSILLSRFYPTHFLAIDIKKKSVVEEFKNYIYSMVPQKKTVLTVTDKTPFELLAECGYTLYECHTEDEIRAFLPYYSFGEELCTFHGGRLKTRYVFFAVKENASKIKREDFPVPSRQDAYGTSVISIQFSRGPINTLMIANRYNHIVENADSTFSNNLENIIAGLTDSFERHYHFNISQNPVGSNEFIDTILNYVMADNGIYYRCNIKKNNVYYCEGNILIENGRVIGDYSSQKERYIIMDYFILDLKDKTITMYDDHIHDSFIDSIYGVGTISNIQVKKGQDHRTIVIEYENNKTVEITIDDHNSIIGYRNDYVEEIGPYFLKDNIDLQFISLPQVKTIGNCFLQQNNRIQSLDLPNVEDVHDYFLCYCQLRNIFLPKVKHIGSYFMAYDYMAETVNLPEVEKIGSYFISYGENVREVLVPNIVNIGNAFLYHNYSLPEIKMPHVQSIGMGFLANNPFFEDCLDFDDFIKKCR